MPKKAPEVEAAPPFLEGVGDESRDYRVQDPNYGATNAFIPIEEGVPAVTYYMLKANLALPIPRTLISTKNKGWDKKSGDPILIEYCNVTDLKDLLDERVGLWTSEVMSFQQIGNSLCIVVRISVFATDGVFHSDGTGIESLSSGGFGDPFSNAYAQGFRRACEGHGMGREMWRKSEHVENANADFQEPPAHHDNSERAEHTQERPEFDPVAKTLSDMVTAKQLGLIRSIAKEGNLDAAGECRLKMRCGIEELSKRAASEFIEHLQNASRQQQSAPPLRAVQRTEPTHSGAQENAPPSGPPASQKQLEYISNLCVEKGMNEEFIALDLFKEDFQNISKSQASKMIEHILGKKD